MFKVYVAMHKAALYWLSGIGLCVALLLAAVLWIKAPPAAAQLLPECDAILYANLKPLRTLTHFDRAPISRAAEYQEFVEKTGIVPERDLNTVALAIHRMDDPKGPNGAAAYSEVFEGRFDAGRLERYLASIANAQESYAGKTIYVIPVGEGGRRLRVAVLGPAHVIASNAPTPEQIHAMLDSGRSGPSLLSARYDDVPWLASAWGVGRLALPLAEGGWATVGGLRLPVREDAQLVASARYLGDGVKLRVEEITGSAIEAARTAEEMSSMLTLVRAVTENQPGGKAGVGRTAMESIAVGATGDRVVLRATVPVEWLRQMTSSSTGTQH